MAGDKIHILEELDVAGGSLDGTKRPHAGFVVRGGREMENHFECLWDMYRSIPSLRIPGASYLDEYYWLDKEDPNSSNCRLIHQRGNEVASDGLYQLGPAAKEIIKLIMTPEEEIQGKTIEEYFSPEFFLRQISGPIGQLCLLLKSGIHWLRCAVTACALSTILMVCLTFLL